MSVRPPVSAPPPGVGSPPREEGGILLDPPTGSTLEERGGFQVLHLRGSPYERGAAHGRLLRETIRVSGVVEYYGNLIYDLYRTSSLSKVPAPVRKVLEGILEWYFIAALEKLFMEETRDELFGVADACGLERTLVLRASIVPDLLEIMAASFLKETRGSLGDYYVVGCSGAYARGGAVRRPGAAVLGRNLDFPGALVWQNPVLLFSHPTEEIDTWVDSGSDGLQRARKRKQPYLYISMAGFPGFGLTGWNASGLTVASFQCLSRNVSRNQRLSLDFNHYLFTRAESVPCLLHLLEDEAPRSTTPHSVLFADREQALSVESDGLRNVVRPMARGFDLHVQTNHFQNPLMRRREMEFPLQQEYSIGRYSLMLDAMQAQYGKLDRQTMIDIISCNLDRMSGTCRLVGDFPAQAATLTSVVFEFDTGNFWAASGRPPAVPYNPYHGFNLHDELNGLGRKTRLPVLTRSRLPLGRSGRTPAVTRRMRRSLCLMVRSEEHLMKGNLREAVEDLEAALRLHDDPGYRYLYSLLLLMAGREQQALDSIRSLRCQHVFAPIKKDALLLWEGRCLDLLGRREEAVEAYRTLLNNPPATGHLKTAARRALHRPFSRSRLPSAFQYALMGPLEFI